MPGGTTTARLAHSQTCAYTFDMQTAHVESWLPHTYIYWSAIINFGRPYRGVLLI